MSPDILLFLMFAAYALPIAFVYSKYQDSAATTRSISSIITSQEPFISIADINTTQLPIYAIQTRHFLAACMMLMACLRFSMNTSVV